jgi:hypothetical protein
VQQPSFSATETALILVMRNNTLETQVHGEEAVVCGAVRTGLDGLLHRSPPSVRRGLGRELAVRSSQPCREQLDDGGDVAVVQVPQRSVFGHFDQPYPGIREYRAELLPALRQAQPVLVREISRRHLLRVEHIHVEVYEDRRRIGDGT